MCFYSRSVSILLQHELKDNVIKSDTVVEFITTGFEVYLKSLLFLTGRRGRWCLWSAEETAHAQRTYGNTRTMTLGERRWLGENLSLWTVCGSSCPHTASGGSVRYETAKPHTRSTDTVAEHSVIYCFRAECLPVPLIIVLHLKCFQKVKKRQGPKSCQTKWLDLKV